MITDEKLKQYVHDFFERNPEQFGTYVKNEREAFKKVKEYHNYVKNEEYVLGLQEFEEKQYVDGTIINITNGYSIKQSARQWQDVKHLDFYDSNLEEGQADVILNVLRNYRIPTQALSGIKKSTDDDHDYITPNGDLVNINIKVDKEDKYHKIELMEISVNGKTIYSYNRNTGDVDVDNEVNIDNYFDNEEQKEDIIYRRQSMEYNFEKDLQEQDIKVKTLEQNRKSQSVAVYIPIDYMKEGKDDWVETIIDSRGHMRRRDKRTGRFVKKDLL